MTERRTAPQTITVAAEPEKHSEFLTKFKAGLRMMPTAKIVGVLGDAKITRNWPSGARDAAENELRRRARDPDQGMAAVVESLEALTWSQLQTFLRQAKGTAAQDVVMVEVRRRFRLGKFGPRSQ